MILKIISLYALDISSVIDVLLQNNYLVLMEISSICCIVNYAPTILRLVANIEFTMCVCTMLFAKILQLDNTLKYCIVV